MLPRPVPVDLAIAVFMSIRPKQAVSLESFPETTSLADGLSSLLACDVSFPILYSNFPCFRDIGEAHMREKHVTSLPRSRTHLYSKQHVTCETHVYCFRTILTPGSCIRPIA